jgi:hypothetical protein
MESRRLLQALMDKEGVNPTSLARKIGDPSLQSTIHRFLSRKTSRPKPETLQPVAEHYRIDVAAFYSEKAAHEAAEAMGLSGDGDTSTTIALRRPDAVATPTEGEVEILQWRTGGSMGSGLLLRDQPGVIHGWKVSPEWVRKNVPHCTNVSNLAIVTGFGDSMKGMFNSGDPLVVDTGFKMVDVDAVYFFRVENEGFIKRLQRLPGPNGEMRIKVKSKNPDYDDWFIERGMDFEVFGRVIKVWQGENL